MATGRPFPQITFGGRTDRTGHGNNAFMFPGVGLGLWVGRVRRVTDAMFLDPSRALASLVTDEDLAEGSVYPRLTRIRDCAHAVACAVIRRAAGRTTRPVCQSPSRLLNTVLSATAALV